MEVHETGWLASWTSLALVPNKRLIIEVPFVAAKAIPSRRSRRCGWVTNAVHQKNRQATHRGLAKTPSLLCYSWPHDPGWVALPVAQQLSRGIEPEGS